MTSYTGTTLNYPITQQTPIKRVKFNRPPAQGNFANFILGDEWLDTSAAPYGEWWKLATLASGGLVWIHIGGSAGDVQEFNVDAHTAPGTDPVVPDANGAVTLTGAQVAAGTTSNVIRTDSLAANTVAIEVQRASAQASSTVGANGVSHFNSAQFSVNSDGFVTLAGGGQAVDSFSTTVGGPVTPDGTGNIALTGASSTFTVGSVANTIRTEVQGTNHALFVGRGTNTAATTLSAATNGQLPIGSTGADAVIAALTAGPGISVTNGAGSITLSTTSSTLPAFLVGLQAVTTNVTGDATLYTMVYDTITYDQLSNFSGGTTFTVPAGFGGLYQFNVQIAMQGIEATHTVGEVAVLINGSGYNAQFNPFNCADSSGRLTWNVPVTALLTAGNLVTTTVQISGNPKTVDVGGSAGFCFWSGVKIN